MARASDGEAAAILVAEDDGAVREFVSRALLRRGYNVTAVADGAQALAALDGAEFALLLADIAMPEVDGVALSHRAAGRHPDMPIVLMTGYAAERERASGAPLAVDAIVAKPFTLGRVCAAAEEAIAKSRRDRRTKQP